MALSILVIEHDDSNRVAIAEALEFEGFHAWQARDGREGLSVTKARLPALIILDQAVPPLGAKEFRRAQKADPTISAIPVVLMAIHEFEVEPDLEATILLKPFGLKDLFEVVTRGLGN